MQVNEKINKTLYAEDNVERLHVNKKENGNESTTFQIIVTRHSENVYSIHGNAKGERKRKSLTDVKNKLLNCLHFSTFSFLPLSCSCLRAERKINSVAA